MSSTGKPKRDRRAEWHQWEWWLPDHLPTCPRCQELCGRLARVCADCGAELYPTASVSVMREGSRNGTGERRET